MSKILAFNIPLTGHIIPTLEIFTRLDREGYEIEYYGDSKFASLFAHTRISLKDYPDGKNDYFDSSEFRDFSSIFLSLMRFSTDHLEYLIRQVKIFAPDIIIHDQFCPWGKYIGQLLKIPTITSVVSLLYDKGAVNQMDSFSFGIFDNLAVIQKANALRKELIEYWRLPDYGILDSLGNRGSKNLVFSMPEIQPEKILTDSDYVFCGPCLRSARDESLGIDFSSLERPVHYISLGTTFENKRGKVEDFLDALGSLKGSVILYEKLLASVSCEYPLPKNIHTFSFSLSAQSEILSHSDSFLTHGGMGSIHEAVFFGVPMVFYPTHAEHIKLAEQFSKMNLGVVLEDVTGKGIQQCLDAVISSTMIQSQIKYQSEKLRKSGGTERAVNTIQKVIESAKN